MGQGGQEQEDADQQGERHGADLLWNGDEALCRRVEVEIVREERRAEVVYLRHDEEEDDHQRTLDEVQETHVPVETPKGLESDRFWHQNHLQ